MAAGVAIVVVAAEVALAGCSPAAASPLARCAGELGADVDVDADAVVCAFAEKPATLSITFTCRQCGAVTDSAQTGIFRLFLIFLSVGPPFRKTRRAGPRESAGVLR